MTHSEKQRLKHLIVETIQVLCKNSLPNESSFCVEATIGITLSNDRAMVISFKERVNANGSPASLMVTDEKNCEQQRSSRTKCETVPYLHSSFSGYSNNMQQQLLSESPTMSEQTEITQTQGNNTLADEVIGMLENSVVDNRTVPSHMALSSSTSVSAANHFSAPVTDDCCNITRTLAETDSTDDVVIFKVEEGSDVAPVNDMQQFDTPFAAPTVQSASDMTKRRRQRERFGGYMVQDCSGQPTSACGEINDMQHTDGSHQQMPAFDVS